MATEQQHFDAARRFQEFYDQILRTVGMRAPQPVLGQSVNQYRRETLRQLKKTFLPQNHDLYQVQCRKLPPDALGVFEPQILRACVDAANDPSHLEPGELRKVERLDEFGKLRFVDWIGKESFVRAMGRPGRRVLSFRTNQGAVDASGRFLR
jgi:hypothetical protein